MRVNMLKLGIIGAGRLGTFHADKAAAHRDVQLVGVFDSLAASRETLAQKHGAEAFAEIDALLAVVDAVVVATPTVSHHAVGMRALAAGRHLLMEKPLAVSKTEAAELVAAARSNRCVLQVGHVERFNPAWQAAAPVLDGVLCGEPALFESVRTSGYTFRSTDIGTVLDMMIHDLDLILSVETSPLLSVSAFGFHQIDPSRRCGHEDTVHAYLRFQSGSTASLFTSRIAPEAERRMKITMQNVTAHIDFGTRKTRIMTPKAHVRAGRFAPDKVPQDQIATIAPTFMKEQFLVREYDEPAVDALALEMDDFVESIARDREPLASGSQALRAVAVAEQIVESLRTATEARLGRHSLRAAS